MGGFGNKQKRRSEEQVRALSNSTMPILGGEEEVKEAFKIGKKKK